MTTATVTPIRPVVVEDLSRFSADALLDAIERLTHRIHTANDADRREHLRAERTLARAELLHRIEAP